jgi:lysophospholipase L1-like esterase
MKLIIPALLFFIFTGICCDVKAQTPPSPGMNVSCPESAKYYAKDSINVVTFGASTVEGVNGLDFQSFLFQNFQYCYTGKSINIYKNGVGGETTTQSLLRLDNAIRAKTGFIVLMVGVNDAIRIEAGRQTIAETEASMREIIVKSLNQKLIPMVCTLQLFDDRNDARLRRVNNIINQINNLYRRLVTEYKLSLIDINRVFRRDFSLYQDNVHPNSRGYRLMSYIIFDSINKVIAERFLQFTVSQNYPNPVTNFTSIDIVMPEADNIKLNIYNLQGKLVYSLVNEYINTGKHIVRLDLSNLPSGVYIYRVTSYSGLYTTTKKLILRR